MGASFRPARSIDEIKPQPLQRDECVRVKTASVLLADYDALQADFPQLRDAALVRHHPELRTLGPVKLRRAVEGLIDEWLVAHGGLMSTTQVKQRRVNGAIAVGPESVPVYRPPSYGRAGIVAPSDSWESLPSDWKRTSPKDPPGLLDLKGIGVGPGVKTKKFELDRHISVHGLCLLGRAVNEYTWQFLLREIFAHAGTSFGVLPIYAVIDLGFEDYRGRPVGVQVRRAHARYSHCCYHPIGSAPYRAAVVIELLLRHYGVTTVGTTSTVDVRIERGRGRYRIDKEQLGQYSKEQIRKFLDIVAPGQEQYRSFNMNVQTTLLTDPRSLATELYDLDVLYALPRFDDSVMMLVGNRAFRWGGAIDPAHPAYVQPDPACAVAVTKSGFAAGRKRQPAERNQLPGAELALAVRAGRMSRHDVERRIRTSVARVVAAWPKQSDGLARAHRAADALFEAAATTGTRILSVEKSRESALSLDAAEALLALQELSSFRVQRARDRHVAELSRHRLHWAARRFMASDAIRTAEARLRKPSPRGGPASKRARAAVLAAAAALRSPTSLTTRKLRKNLDILLGDALVNACVEGWAKRLQRRA